MISPREGLQRSSFSKKTFPVFLEKSGSGKPDLSRLFQSGSGRAQRKMQQIIVYTKISL